MLSLIRLAVAGAALAGHALYLLGWQARSAEHYARGTLSVAAGALLAAAALRAWRRNEPVNPVMIAAVCLLVIISTVVGMVY